MYFIYYFFAILDAHKRLKQLAPTSCLNTNNFVRVSAGGDSGVCLMNRQCQAPRSATTHSAPFLNAM